MNYFKGLKEFDGINLMNADLGKIYNYYQIKVNYGSPAKFNSSSHRECPYSDK